MISYSYNLMQCIQDKLEFLIEIINYFYFNIHINQYL